MKNGICPKDHKGQRHHDMRLRVDGEGRCYWSCEQCGVVPVQFIHTEVVDEASTAAYN